MARDFFETWMKRIQEGGSRQVEWYTFPLAEIHRWEIYEVERPANEGNCVTLSAWVWPTAESDRRHFFVKLFLQDGKTRLFHASLNESVLELEEWLNQPVPEFIPAPWDLQTVPRFDGSNRY
ncbi:MAG: hypothetical protein AAF514_18310 [Verrucomicrobiota bacterium]